MRKSLIIMTIGSLSFATSSSAETLKLIDPECIAVQMKSCNVSTSGQEPNAFNGNQRINATSSPGATECYYRAVQMTADGKTCLQIISLPSASEMTEAIRSGNDKVLKAALDAIAQAKAAAAPVPPSTTP